MQKIILDTNVIVSSLIQKNYPYLIVEHCIEGNATICLSNEILQEYIEVLNRPKFSRFADFKTNADFLITRLCEMAENYEPKTKLDVITDEPDNYWNWLKFQKLISLLRETRLILQWTVSMEQRF